MAEAIGAQLVSLGSAGAKAMTVVSGQTDAYLHVGGMYEWDSAAPAAVAASAGLHVSRADGAPLVYNRADPWLPDLLICRPELADACLDAIDRAW
jgi:3'(2'), 5'-bisphosphate nucleotidase